MECIEKMEGDDWGQGWCRLTHRLINWIQLNLCRFMVRQSPNLSKSCNVVQNEPKYAMTLKRLEIYTKYSKTRLISWSKPVQSMKYQMSIFILVLTMMWFIGRDWRCFFHLKFMSSHTKSKRGRLKRQFYIRFCISSRSITGGITCVCHEDGLC